MEDNKAYLQKIHWIFLLGIVYGFSHLIVPRYNIKPEDYKIELFLVGSGTLLLKFIALGIITRKWKQGLISWSVSLLSPLAYIFINPQLNASAWLLTTEYLFAHFPFLLFMGLSFGWHRKLISAFVLIMMTLSLWSTAFASPETLAEFIGWFKGRRIYVSDKGYGYDSLIVSCQLIMFVIGIICLAETVNYLKGKAQIRKTILLNLGNRYTKFSSLSLLLFVILHLFVFVGIAGIYGTLEGYARMIVQRNYSGDHDKEGHFMFYLIVGLPHIILCLLSIFPYAWYQRKFLLEVFISLGIRSRFVYWLLQIPVLGILIFGVLLMIGKEKRSYNEKLEAMGRLAASKTTAITAMLFILTAARILFYAVYGTSIEVVAALAAFFLLIWLIAAKTGYYAALLVNTLALVLLVLSPLFITDWTWPSVFRLIPFMLFNMIQLILIFPVYHFEEFEYIPAENPVPDNAEIVHLLG